MPSLTCHIISEIQNSHAVEAEVQREKNPTHESKNLGEEAVVPVGCPAPGSVESLRKLSLPLCLGGALTTFCPQSNFCSCSKRTLRWCTDLFSLFSFLIPEHPVFSSGRASQQPCCGLGFARGVLGNPEEMEGVPRRSCAATQGKLIFSPICYIFSLCPFFCFSFSVSKWYPP